MEHQYSRVYTHAEVYMQVPDDIMIRYFERRKRDVEDCIEHLQSGDMRFIEKVGHQLKGNGVTFGYPELSVIGSEMEMAAQSGDKSVISHVVGKLSDWVENHLN